MKTRCAVSTHILLLLPMVLLFLLCACGQTVSQEQESITAVLTEDTVLYDPYSCLTASDGTPAEWLSLDVTETLPKDSILILLGTQDGTANVVVPYGDIPFLYGFVPLDSLSTDPVDIAQGSQAIAVCTAYDAMDGQAVTDLTDRVHILTRQNGWAEVTPSAGGDPRHYWVRLDDLSFDFHSDGVPFNHQDPFSMLRTPT